MTTEVRETVTPADTSSHEEEMVKKAEEQERLNRGEPPADKPEDKSGDPPERPEWCPEKFWDAEKGEVRQEELAKSYRELESGKTGEGNEGTPSEEEQKETEEKLTKADPTVIQTAADEFAKDGKLSDETYQALEASGLDRAKVDAYITGQQARSELFMVKVHEEVGGKAEWESLSKWAQANLDPAELEEYNRTVTNPQTTPEQAMSAIRGLHARYQLSNGTQPSREIDSNSGNGGSASTDVYTSKEDLMKDMAAPKYRSSPHEQRRVAEKIARSASAGYDLFT